MSRGGAAVARRAHNPKVVGSNPAPATKLLGLEQVLRLTIEIGCRQVSISFGI